MDIDLLVCSILYGDKFDIVCGVDSGSKAIDSKIGNEVDSNIDSIDNGNINHIVMEILAMLEDNSINFYGD